mmetsp:Transcript_27465/g.44661  ORF Transcript_27465/g.44661 Transcript_27465/m.44661 type:complete len:224 (+) Transcript_27465:16-687(+)
MKSGNCVEVATCVLSTDVNVLLLFTFDDDDVAVGASVVCCVPALGRLSVNKSFAETKLLDSVFRCLGCPVKLEEGCNEDRLAKDRFALFALISANGTAGICSHIDRSQAFPTPSISSLASLSFEPVSPPTWSGSFGSGYNCTMILWTFVVTPCFTTTSLGLFAISYFILGHLLHNRSPLSHSSCIRFNFFTTVPADASICPGSAVSIMRAAMLIASPHTFGSP